MDDDKIEGIITSLKIIAFCVSVTLVVVIGIAYELEIFFWQ